MFRDHADNPMFQKWNAQVPGKYGFIPLGPLKLPDNDKKSISQSIMGGTT